jgi:hypothetical protein
MISADSPPNNPRIFLAPFGDGRPALVLEPPSDLGPDERVRQVAAAAVAPEPAGERQAVGRVAVLAVERRHAGLALREQGRVDELGDVPDPDQALDGMNQIEQTGIASEVERAFRPPVRNPAQPSGESGRTGRSIRRY